MSAQNICNSLCICDREEARCSADAFTQPAAADTNIKSVYVVGNPCPAKEAVKRVFPNVSRLFCQATEPLASPDYWLIVGIIIAVLLVVALVGGGVYWWRSRRPVVHGEQPNIWRLAVMTT